MERPFTNITIILSFTQHSMGKIGPSANSRAVSELYYMGP